MRQWPKECGLFSGTRSVALSDTSYAHLVEALVNATSKMHNMAAIIPHFDATVVCQKG